MQGFKASWRIVMFAILLAVTVNNCGQDDAHQNIIGPMDNEPVNTSLTPIDNNGDEYQTSLMTSDIEYGLIQANQQTSFTLWQAYQVYSFTFQPWQIGTWDLQSWHTDPLPAYQFATISYYWRNALNPSDPWHYITSDNVYLNVHTHETLHSGSIGITYKMKMGVANSSWAPLDIKVKAVSQ